MTTGQILIVETDDLIRGLILRWLDEAGYAVAQGGSPPGGVALVIADLPNPAQADAMLHDLAACHGAPILATSGRFRRDAAASEGVARLLGIAKALPKPFTCEELLTAVRDCLDGR